MKKILLPTFLLILVACSSVPTQASEVFETSEALPILTPSPMPTFTSVPTATIVVTPTSGLLDNFPSDYKKLLGGKDFKIGDDGRVWVTDADGKDYPWFGLDENNEWNYAQEYLSKILIQAGITPENSYPENDWSMKFYQRQFHGIFPDDITRIFIRTDLTGQPYELECRKIAFYDRNIGKVRIAWVAITANDNGQLIQLVDSYETIKARKAYRMKIIVEETAPQSQYTKEKAPVGYYLFNLLYFPLAKDGNYFNRMLSGESVPWPKDLILPITSIINAFYRE